MAWSGLVPASGWQLNHEVRGLTAYSLSGLYYGFPAMV